MSEEKRKQGALKAKLGSFSKFLTKVQEKTERSDVEIIELSQRLEKIQTLLDEFDQAQAKIVSKAKTDDLAEEYAEHELFENQFYAAVSAAKFILNQNKEKSEKTREGSPESVNTGPSASELSETRPSSISNHIKLPIIQLPKFDGNYSGWLEFRDTYESMIHKNESIPDIQKFHYLRSALDGSAAVVIRSLECTSSNYNIAWQALLERYNNNKLLTHNHVKALFNIEPIHKESCEGLRRMMDTLSKNLRALEQLGQPTDQWDTLIVYMLSVKLDVITAREWEKYKADRESPTLDDFKNFLKSRADLLETLQSNQSEKRFVKSNTKGFLSAESQEFIATCKYCKKDHYIQNCPEFLKVPANERYEKVTRLRLCVNCLRSGHFGKMCRRSTCKICQSKHHTLLHHNNKSIDNANEQPMPSTSSVAFHQSTLLEHVLLSTAFVQVLDKHNNPHTLRALLDSGSQSSYLCRETCKRLKLHTSKADVTVIGLNNTKSNVESKCDIIIQSLHNDFSTNLRCFVIPEITGNLPNVKLRISEFNIPRNIKLADPEFFRPQGIDMLIGADLFWKLICIGQISLGNNKPVLQKTRFGWIVSGPIASPCTSTVRCNFSKTSEVQNQLARFWELEECSPTQPFSKAELACEAHFVQTTKRAKDGRFIVSLPFKNSVETLGDSFEQAKRRLFSLERKLQARPMLKEQYDTFLTEYETLGHMTKIERPNDAKVAYYMPHHAVVREKSLTTKVRVVFDASAPTTSGISLNNLQFTGPIIQQELLSILLRFRQHAYVVAGDIAKMYRQVEVVPEQRPLQRILWRKNTADPVAVYQLNTVTYGTTAASFLCIRCLFQLADENQIQYPEFAEIIKSDFYVDDMLTGAESIEKAALIARGVSDILKQGGFDLRKFYSNNNGVLKYIAVDQSDNRVLEFGVDENTKTLGLAWSPNSDHLIYNIGKQINPRVTKRTILSCVAQIFDPLGLLSPCIILAKILLQRLWLEKLSWDESLPAQLDTEWRQFRAELGALNNLHIERHVLCATANYIEIHGFADASEKAYGACVFVRSINPQGKIAVNLLCSKTKVAPLKSTTLPRLELSAALILARLLDKVSQSLRLKIDKRVCWSDSTVVLGWLKTPPNCLKTFVGNRVAEIQELTARDVWRHICSKDNPADVLSRGVNPSAINGLRIWWHGPSWLSQVETDWPRSIVVNNVENVLPEIKLNSQVFAINHEGKFPFEKFSSLKKLQRVTAWILRFKHNCNRSRAKDNELMRRGPLSITELSESLKMLVKMVQNETFSGEISYLHKGKQLGLKGRLAGLHPFLDSDKILRVGGRLENSDFSFDKKHPIILCAKHHFSKLLIRQEHIRLLHAGPQQVLASIREQFWPILGRNAVKKIVRECVICFRHNPQAIQPIMGQLPRPRLQPGPPFNTTGVDYAGPFYIKNRSGRGARLSKCYVGLFICFATKAIHLELITDLSKDAFILALKRFVARRGKPARIFSDNGTHFTSAYSELRDMGNFFKQSGRELAQYFVNNNIDWQFIPPYSPHFGGIWEAGVKSCKGHLKRVIGKVSLTFEELYTLLVQVEAVVNSRPLFPLSADPSDLIPLTPAHFLIGRSLVAVPEVDLTEIKIGRLSRFQLVQQMQQHFWSRWYKEYVSEMQQRTKWKKTRGQLNIGAMVVIKDDKLPPLCWKLGRVINLHPGVDGVSRVATIKTINGDVKRSLTKLCPLPPNSDNLQEPPGCFQGGGHVQN